MVATIFARVTKMFCKAGRLRSKYLYFSLRFSPTLARSDIANGGVSAEDNISIASASSSISPVAILGLTFFSPRRRTVPVAFITYSLRITAASSKSSALFPESKFSCNIPVLSLRSTNMILPKFLYLATKPYTVTCLPTSETVNSPHIFVLLEVILLISVPPLLHRSRFRLRLRLTFF